MREDSPVTADLSLNLNRMMRTSRMLVFLILQNDAGHQITGIVFSCQFPTNKRALAAAYSVAKRATTSATDGVSSINPTP